MSAPGLAALAFGLGVVALLVRHRPTVPWLVGLMGIGLVFLGAWSLPVGLRAAIGGETFVTTGYLRLFLMLLAITGGVLTLVAWASALTRALPGLVLVWFAAAAAGLAIADPLPAILILTIGSLIPVLGGVTPGAAHDAIVLGGGLRGVLIAGLLAAISFPVAALAGAVLEGAASPSLATAASASGALGLAFLLAAGGVALRAGAVPLHGWLGRLSEALATPAIPVIFAWGPATLAIVMLGWTGDQPAFAGQPLGIERLIVNIVAIASLALGAVAALLHDDLEHVVGYSLVADAGILLLAMSSLDPAGWAAARAWILAYVVARSAFAGWATALALAYGTRRIPDLAGWARRSPLLAGSLAVIGLTTVGVPGLAAFEARSRIVDLALDVPFDAAATVGILAAAGYFGRLLVTGFRRPSTQVALAIDLQPTWPGERPGRISGELLRQVPGVLRLNRRPASALAVFGLAMLGLAVAAGAFRGPTLAGQPGPAAGPAASASPGASSPGPSGGPGPSQFQAPSPGSAASPGGIPAPTPAASPGSSVTATPTGSPAAPASSPTPPG